jgi:hypothetical protein
MRIPFLKKYPHFHFYLSFALVTIPSLLDGAPLVSFGDALAVHALGSTKFRYESNILSTQVGVDDFITTVSPGLGIDTGTAEDSKVKGDMQFFEDYEIYADRNEFNDFKSRLQFQGSYDQGSRLTLDTAGGFQESSQNNAEENVKGSLIRRHNYNFNINGYYQLSEKTKFDTGFGWDETDFRNFTESFHDRDSYRLPLNAYYIYSKKIDLGLGYEFGFTDSHQTTIPDPSLYDISSHFVNLRVKGEIGPRLTTLSYIGIKYRQFQGISSDTGPSFKTNLKWEATQKLQLTVGVSSDSDSNGTGASFTKTGGNLGAEYTATDKIKTGVSSSYSVDDFDFSDRSQRQFNADWYLEYTYSEYLNLTFGYSYFNNDSGISSSSYHNHIANVAANVKY